MASCVFSCSLKASSFAFSESAPSPSSISLALTIICPDRQRWGCLVPPRPPCEATESVVLRHSTLSQEAERSCTVGTGGLRRWHVYRQRRHTESTCSCSVWTVRSPASPRHGAISSYSTVSSPVRSAVRGRLSQSTPRFAQDINFIMKVAALGDEHLYRRLRASPALPFRTS